MPRKEKQYHYIYKTTNKVNGKFYFGMHSTHNLNDGYKGSGHRLRQAIKKHGEENFITEILEFLPNREALKKREEEIITEDLIKHDKCMNLQPGGGGGFTVEQQKENGRRANEKIKEVYSKDPDWLAKRSKNISDANKEAYQNGTRKKVYFYDWSGRTHNEETKKKIGLINSERQKGERNSQFGTCWINNGVENKKIKKDLLDTYLIVGWVKGRI